MEFLQIPLDNTELREHQVLAKSKIFDAWKSKKSVMLQMPTGTGKTYLFTSIIKDIIRAYKAERKEINILVVAHRTELLDQISSTLDKFGIPHGFIQGGRQQHLWRRVQVGSIMSLLTEKNYMNTIRQKFDYIIIDEAHHSLAETYSNLFNLFPEARKLGVTATPWRLNHESFLSLYQELIVSPQISWFIKRNLLANFEYVSIKPDSEIQKLVDRSEISDTGDFVNSDLDNTFNNQRIRSKLFESYKNYADGRKGIIYAINKIHAAKIAAMYSGQGVKAVAIDCDTPKDERQNYISLFKSGEIKVLVNVDIFTEGFDCPDVSFIQLARPTRSLALYLQQVGRGLRITEGKDKTIILDNVGLYNYFGLPDADRRWHHHFIGRDDVEKENEKSKVLISKEDSDYSFDETKLEEDNEPMIIVRSAHHLSHDGYFDTSEFENTVESLNEPESSIQDVCPVEEFVLSDYYLVRGNQLKFSIYPFIKKKGKATEAVGNAVFDYLTPIVLTTNIEENKKEIEKNIKLHSLLMFTVQRIGLSMDEVFDLKILADKSNSRYMRTATLFDILKMMSKV